MAQEAAAAAARTLQGHLSSTTEVGREGGGCVGIYDAGLLAAAIIDVCCITSVSDKIDGLVWAPLGTPHTEPRVPAILPCCGVQCV